MIPVTALLLILLVQRAMMQEVNANRVEQFLIEKEKSGEDASNYCWESIWVEAYRFYRCSLEHWDSTEESSILLVSSKWTKLQMEDTPYA